MGIASATPCLNAASLEKLRLAEQDYLLQRIPPAFRHGVEDKNIQFNMTVDEAETCTVTFNIVIPAADLVEGARILDADPAKRIMLFSQGQALPEKPESSAQFKVNPTSLEIAHEDILQTGSLGKLRASVELLYATLTQSRAAVAENASNSKAWRAAFRDSEAKTCSERMSAASDILKACQCKADALSAKYSEREMDHQYYIRSNPYSYATGTGKTFGEVEQQIEQACGLKKPLKNI